MRWLDSITNSVDMNVSKLWETVKDSLASCSPWGCKESDMTQPLNKKQWMLSVEILIRSPLYFFPRTGYWCKLGQSEILHHGPLHGILNLNWILNRRTMILKVWIVGFPSHIAKFLDHTVLHMWFHCNSCFLAFHSFYKPPSTCLWFKLAESLSIAYN